MNCIIPFTKDIKFNVNISEILSISLEQEYTANEGELLGNFIISGDYKTHEVSVNCEHFEHVLPFSVSMSNRVDLDSVDLAVEDFTYEIVDHNTLRVNIEYNVTAKDLPEEEVVFEPVNDEPLEDLIDEDFKREEIIEEPEEIEEIKEQVSEIDEEVEEQQEEKGDEIMETEVLEERDVSENDKAVVLEHMNTAEETFVTYNIHIMQETDTIEAVCTKYNTTQSILGEYNDLSTVTVGDKLLIPDINE